MKINYSKIISVFLFSAAIGIGISYSELYMFHIMLCGVMFLLLDYFLIKKEGIVPLPTKYHYFFVFMLLWYTLSLTWSINLQYSLKYLFYIVCGIAIALTIVYASRTEELFIKYFKVVAAVFLLEVFFSLLEMLTPFRLPISPFSKYIGLFGRQGSDLSLFNENAVRYLNSSPTGFRWNPNNLATMMSLIFPFFLCLKNNLYKYLGIIAVTAIIVGTGSRGNIVALMLIVMVFLLLKFKKTLMILLSAIIFFSVTTISLEVASKYEINNKKIQEVIATYDVLKSYLFSKVESGSIGTRQQLIENGFSALHKTGGIGVGGGGSVEVQERKFENKKGKVITSMHNFWVEVLVEGGILFSTIFAVWYLSVIRKLIKIYKTSTDNKSRYLSFSLVLSLSGFIIGAISPSSVIYFFPMWIIFGFSVAYINLKNIGSATNEDMLYRKF